MTKRGVICALLAWASLAQHSWAQGASGHTAKNLRCTVPKLEMEVIMVYLRDMVVSPHHLSVVVSSTDAPDIDVDSVNLQLAVRGQGIPPDVRADFKKKAKSVCEIQPIAGMGTLRFISKSEDDQIFRRGWREFHRRYGKNADINSITRVGFNSDKTLALFHSSSGISPMGGAGSLYLFERKGGKWVKKAEMITWTT